MLIEKIPLTGETIANAIMASYPNGKINLDEIKKNKLYNYVVLYGIRLQTCDTGLMDDAIGGIRLRKSFTPLVADNWEIINSNATTDPTPYWLINSTDPIPAKYGTAWTVEGQYRFYPAGNFQGYPSFRPVDPIPVYRWKPSKEEIKRLTASGKPLSSGFESAKARGEVKIIAPTTSILIHRSWGSSSRNSAGCQVFSDNGALTRLYSWGLLHNKLYKTPMIYTLLTKNQFVIPNQGFSTTPLQAQSSMFFSNTALNFINLLNK
jgi:hypothetical protein